MSKIVDKLTSYDNLTMLLGGVLFLAFGLSKWLTPVSLVHPILLGRQSDVSRSRKPGKSAVYRNYGTGAMGILPARPAKEIKLLADLLAKNGAEKRQLWSHSISNSELDTRSTTLAYGLIKGGNLIPNESNALLLLEDSLEFLLADLALSKCSIPSFTLTSLQWLAPVLEHYPPSAIFVNARLVPQILELIHESHEHSHHTIVIVGEDPQATKLLKSVPELKSITFVDLENAGKQGSGPSITLPVIEPSTVVNISFFGVENGQPVGVQFTHENIVAGVTATRVLLPLNEAFKTSDTIYSAHSLSSSMGRAIAYTALYEGTNFTTTDSTSFASAYNLKTPRDISDLVSTVNTAGRLPPTVLFIDATHVESITRDVLDSAKSNVLFKLAFHHKLSHLHNGYLSRDSLWDTLAFASSRTKALGKVGGKLRAAIITSPLESDTLVPTQVALSVPLVKTFIHPFVCGPVFASHPLDLQSFPSDGPSTSHVGPPSVNISALLIGVDDAAIESGVNPSGQLLVQGPSVGKGVPTSDTVEEDNEAYTRLQCRAVVRSNGTFSIY